MEHYQEVNQDDTNQNLNQEDNNAPVEKLLNHTRIAIIGISFHFFIDGLAFGISACSNFV